MKWALRLLLGGLALLVVLAGVAAWLVATPAGLRAAVGLANTLGGSALHIEGTDGRLADAFGLRTVRIETTTQRIELDDLRVVWRPRALSARALDVESMTVSALRVVTLAPDDSPLVVPTSLRAPLVVRVARFDLARLDLIDERGVALHFDALRLAVDGRDDHWHIEGLHVRTPWAQVRGTLRLAQDAPFALTGELQAIRDDPMPVHAAVHLSGTLPAPAFDVRVSSEGMHVGLVGEAAPFEAVKLAHLLVSGEGIALRAFAAEAPEALFAFAGVFEGRPGERLFGTFSIVNALPGRLDRDRLPLVQLTAAVLGDRDTLAFSDLAIDLGAAGRLAGVGRWQAAQLELQLASAGLDLAGLHRALAPTRLVVEVSLAGDTTRQTLTGTLRERWGRGAFSLVHADDTLTLTTADFSGEAGQLKASGALKLDASRSFDARIDAARINPARFGAFPRGRLNLAGTLRGAFAPLRLDADLNLPPGELEGRPVSGRAVLQLDETRLAAADVDLDLAGNQIQLEGGWGRETDRLRWAIDAPALGRLGWGLAGRLVSTGTLTQSAVAGRAEARALRLPGEIAVAALEASLKLDLGARGVFDGELEVRDAVLAGHTLTHAQAKLAGRRDAHGVEMIARLPNWQLAAELSGGLDSARTWRGRVDRAALDGEWPVRLLAPADVQLSASRQQISGLRLSVAGGRVELIDFSRDDTTLRTRGQFVSLPLAPLVAGLEAAPVETDLRLSGDWNMTLADTLAAEVRINRAGGDVRLLDPALTLGIEQLALTVNAANGETRATLALDTRAAGRVRAEGRAPLAIEAGVPVMSRAAPLVWSLRADVPNLAAARPVLPVGMRLDARLAVDLAGSGTLAAPRIDGSIRAEGVRFALPEEGVYIEGGQIDLALAEDRIRVRSGELLGRNGRIRLAGEAELRNPRAGLTLEFQRFSATQRSDRRIDVSGTTQLALAERRLRLAGTLTVDRARLDMPEAGRPELSPDVVVIGQPPRSKEGAGTLPLDLDLMLHLGNDFLFKGAGLDAKLGGRLRVYSAGDLLRGDGVIQVERGRYAAYAQTLDITRGVLRFAGPLNNPGLDVLAVRTTPTVVAGVQVRGTVLRPVVSLYSDPAMPDTEKLAWIVLGRGLDNAGQQDFVLMQLAASALLSRAESVNFQTALAETLRIDSFDVRAGDGEDVGTAIVSVGKRLSTRATLSYEQSLDGLTQVVKVLYQLNPRVRLEAQAGQQSSIDAFYTREYD